jgi:membrane protease YdiL (CAAX protease family)
VDNPPNHIKPFTAISPSTTRAWLLIALFIFAAVVLGMLFNDSFTLESVWIWLQWSAAVLVCIVPVIALAIWRGKPENKQNIGLALGVWFMNFSCLLLMNRLPIFSDLAWNWTGKVFAIIATLAFIGLWHGVNWREIGFAGLRKGSWRPFIVLTGLWFLLSGWQPGGDPTKLESLLFNLSLPAIDEELIYRGVLLALLNRSFGTPWKVLGASVGWGWVICSVLFGLVHGVGFDQSQFQFDLAPIIFTGIGGLIMGWVRERTGSLFSSMALHGIGDGAGYAVNALVNGLVM